MLKPWLQLTSRIAFAFLLLGSASAQESADSILFLHLRRDATGITLLRAESRPGHLKPKLQDGSLEYELSSPDGSLLQSGQLADPLLERIEYPHATEPGSLRTEVVTRDFAEFTLRVPANGGARTVRFFRRAALDGGKLRALAERELLSEITIPETTERLEGFATNAKRYTLLTNGPMSGRLNIAILAEGFTSAQETNFTNRATTVLNQFLAASPYREYRNHFNAFAIFVPSAQAGSDHPTTGVYRNTYFNSSYGTGGLVRLITIPPNDFNSSYSAGRGKVDSLLQQFVPEYDIALLLVNDTEYGGSGGYPAIASINSSSAELALHEIGHSFGNLGDEYEDETPGYPDIEHANTTKETRREFIKWRNWINASTPVPTPETTTYGNVVGLFEGAYFHANGWYRPKLDCRMRSLGVDFCQVCKETIVLSAYKRLDVIQSSSPIENNLIVPGGGQLELKVSAVAPVQTPLTYKWSINGVTNASYTSSTFPASFPTLGIGSHLVRVSVQDPTPLVRTDTRGDLWQTRSWLVQVVSATNQPPAVSAIASQYMDSGTTLAVSFTVSDPDTPIDSLQLLATQDNPGGGVDLQLQGSGTNRSLIVTARCDFLGARTVTISARDADNVTSTSFVVEVSAPGRPPIVVKPVEDQRLFAGRLSVPIQISYVGCERELLVLAESSNQSVLPNSGLVVEGSGTNRILHLQPLPNQYGSAGVQVSVTEGISLALASFTVTFLKPPVAVASPPEQTSNGVLLRFTSEPAAAMVLEHSLDFRLWTPVVSNPSATSLEHLIPKASLGNAGFYRLRLLPL